MPLTDAQFFSHLTSAGIEGSGGLSGGGVGVTRRVPFTFTSTARLIRSGKVNSLGNGYTSANAKVNQYNALLAIEEETRPISTIFRSGQDSLTAIVPTDNLSPVISMAVNPHSVKWSQPKRFTKRDTMTGSTFFHFTDSADQNNDILTCTFTGRTGNINTKVSSIEALATGANMKLKIWHDLYNISREGLLLNNANTHANVPKGIKNEFFIAYRTMLMPVPITMIGFFNTALEFTEDAADPFNRVYSFSFTVTDTSPKLDNLTSTLSGTLVRGNLANTIL